MNEYRLRISNQDFDKLRHLVLSDMPREAGAFALAGFSPLNTGGDIIIRRPIEIPKNMFFLQHEYRLEVSTQAINGLIALCESNGLGAVICHSHPEGLTYSPSDDHGEQRIVGTLRNFIPSNAPTASLLFSPNGVTGRVWVPGKRSPVPLTEIIVIGRSVRRITLNHSPKSVQVDHVYDRQVRAFGRDGQILINNARVGIVGIGGTGSPVAEQLVRLGVGDIVIIDPDVYDDTNVTRVYGTYPKSRIWRWLSFLRKQTSKAGLVAAHLRKINPETKIQVIPLSVVITDAAKKLLDRDVVFLCTDEHWGRSVVNQIVHQYFIPAINLGANITSNDGVISAAVGTIDLLRPDNPCLWCSQFLKSERIAAESTPRSKRRELQREGYIQDVDTKAPSVISITTAVAGMGVSMFNQLITDFMGNTGNVSRLNYNVLDGTVRRGTTMISNDCICKQVRGFGILKTIPTLKDLSYLEE
jgi:hypothetical protein